MAVAALALGLAAAGETRGEAPASTAHAPVRVERRAYLMGTQARLVAVVPDRTWGLRVLGDVLERLEAVEAELSTWRPDSRLSAINRQPPGVTVEHPTPVCDLLVELAGWRERTGGAFDPAVGRLVSAWDLRGHGRRPSPRELESARRDSGLEHLEVRRGPCRVTRRRDVLLDAGGFGKGAAIDRVYRDVSGPPPPVWMVDLGGQVAVAGDAAAPWTVALAHPQRRDEVALRLDLAEGSLATSGGSERDLQVAGGALGHVLDPRTGLTVVRSGSVTVWNRRALAADILSTALYVMGPGPGLAWAEERGVAACFLEPARGSGPSVVVQATRAFRQRFPTAAP